MAFDPAERGDRPAHARLVDLDRVPLGDGIEWRPLRRRFGITGFSANAYSGREVGDHVIEPHDEASPGSGRHEELYVVLSGRGRLHRRRGVDRGAGRLLRLRPAGRAARGGGGGAGDDRRRGRRQAGRRAPRLAVRALVRRAARLRRGRLRDRDGHRLRRPAGLSRSTARSTTSSPATPPWPATAPPRSTTCAPRSRPTRAPASGRATTATWTPLRDDPDYPG